MCIRDSLNTYRVTSVVGVAAMALAATPTTDVTLYVFRRPPSLAKSDGSARLHAERLTMRKARGTVFHDALGEKAEEARLVAVMEAVTTLNDRAHPALSAYTAGQSCRCASSAASGGEDAIARGGQRARRCAAESKTNLRAMTKACVRFSRSRETAAVSRFEIGEKKFVVLFWRRRKNRNRTK